MKQDSDGIERNRKGYKYMTDDKIKCGKKLREMAT